MRQLKLQVQIPGWLMVAAVGVWLLADVRMVLAADPMSGRWQLNLEKSKYDPGPAPKGARRVQRLEGDTLSVDLDIILADGRVRQSEYAVKLDGVDYPTTDEPSDGATTWAWKRIDERTLEFTEKKSGQTRSIGRLQVSQDGTALTLSVKGKNSKGDAFNNLLVFDKR